jgi:hypothetical protein
MPAGNIHTNTIENTFSVFKRGMKGIYQHCGEAHLHRYLAELISATTAALPLVFLTPNEPPPSCAAPTASGWCTKDLRRPKTPKLLVRFSWQNLRVIPQMSPTGLRPC